MRVLMAPDCFTGTLTSTEAGEAMARGWRSAAPHDVVTTLAVSDGGPGFIDAVAPHVGGRSLAVTVHGPLGGEAPAEVLLSGTTAWVESAQACGLALVPVDRRDPGRTTSYGVGELLLAAARAGARKVVVGLGGSATNDAGAGMLAALAGRGADDALARGGEALAGVEAAEVAEVVEQARAAVAGVEIVVASDVDIPLLGFHGASASFAEQKGATPDQAQCLEGALGHLADLVERALPQTRDLLTGSRRVVHREPGAGAAGGLGFGLLALGGHRVSGVDHVLACAHMADLLARHDLVVTGEGTVDWQSLRGKVVAGVAQAVLPTGLPTVILAGQLEVGRRETMALGVAGMYAVATSPEEVEAALGDPAGTLAALAARVARTWSPGR